MQLRVAKKFCTVHCSACTFLCACPVTFSFQHDLPVPYPTSSEESHSLMRVTAQHSITAALSPGSLSASVHIEQHGKYRKLGGLFASTLPLVPRRRMCERSLFHGVLLAYAVLTVCSGQKSSRTCQHISADDIPGNTTIPVSKPSSCSFCCLHRSTFRNNLCRIITYINFS